MSDTTLADGRSIPTSPSWLQALGVAALVGGIVMSLAAVARGGVDFPVLYVMGRALLTGTNVYLPAQAAAFPAEFGVPPPGMFYPPVTCFAFMPLALLPFGVAKWLFALLIDAAIIWGIRAMVRTAAPRAAPHVWMIAAGVVLASAAMRWGMMLLQPSPLILGLLCWFVSLLDLRRHRLAVAIAMLAMILKMTLALPFLGLLALGHRWKNIVLITTTWIALNVFGFWRMGPGAFAQYQRNISGIEELGYINSPDLWRPVALPRLDWVALFYALTESLTFARAATFVLAGVCGLWILWIIFLDRRRTETRTLAPFLGAMVCLGSLIVYHHQYDAILFFAPVILGVLLPERRPRLGHWLIAPLVLMILVLPIGKAQTVLGSVLGLLGIALVKLAFPVAFTLALVGCVLLIHTRPAEPAR
jgi:Glycosyltransferase family 87